MSPKPALFIAWLLYLVESLIHFIHHAEFLSDYPHLPESWTRNGVYTAWAGMSALGIVGLLLSVSRFRLCGRVILVLYTICGIDSLGHYAVASFADHSPAMLGTILLEVGSALMLLAVAVWHLPLHLQDRIGELDSQ